MASRFSKFEIFLVSFSSTFVSKKSFAHLEIPDSPLNSFIRLSCLSNIFTFSFPQSATISSPELN